MIISKAWDQWGLIITGIDQHEASHGVQGRRRNKVFDLVVRLLLDPPVDGVGRLRAAAEVDVDGVRAEMLGRLVQVLFD
jgi:hypothetical protein